MVSKKRILKLVTLIVCIIAFIGIPVFAQQGSNYCRRCMLTGRIDCPNCNGVGKYPTLVKCTWTGRAQGTNVGCRNGKMYSGAFNKSYGNCPQCSGSGTITEYEKCYRCNGRGTINCPTCGGTGYSD